ncbi:hypothetical protein KIW84_033844 [Lathyrus oleraceus]|uniref:Uncharacterized protein n=1 Tax=Pisum sativum TaxID=3888 RepID=A0A9D4XXQ3_PEA|nr:hypothetical protein KIW84_033844 [Pisum sativum]
MTSPRPHEETSSAGDTTTPQVVDTGSNTALTGSTKFVGPILMMCHPQTPTQTTMGTMGQHMPSYTAPIHRTLGMPTEFMENMHNFGLTYNDTSSSPFPLYQGFGPSATPFGRPPGFKLTSQSVPIFTDLVQKALKEGRLQFGEMPKMQVDSDPLKVEEALYVEPLDCMMVDTTDGLIEFLKATSGSKRPFNQHLGNIAPCDGESGSYTSVSTGRVMNLDPDPGFIWDNEEDTGSETGIPPTGWQTVVEDDH